MKMSLGLPQKGDPRVFFLMLSWSAFSEEHKKNGP